MEKYPDDGAMCDAIVAQCAVASLTYANMHQSITLWDGRMRDLWVQHSADREMCDAIVAESAMRDFIYDRVSSSIVVWDRTIRELWIRYSHKEAITNEELKNAVSCCEKMPSTSPVRALALNRIAVIACGITERDCPPICRPYLRNVISHIISSGKADINFVKKLGDAVRAVGNLDASGSKDLKTISAKVREIQLTVQSKIELSKLPSLLPFWASLHGCVGDFIVKQSTALSPDVAQKLKFIWGCCAVDGLDLIDLVLFSEQFFKCRRIKFPNNADWDWWRDHITQLKTLHNNAQVHCNAITRTQNALAKKIGNAISLSLCQNMSTVIEKYLLWKFPGDEHQEKRTELFKEYEEKKMGINGILAAA
jgi:hypothetical protein